ncbi:MAG: hypothetical protein GY845_23660 [Planctomycetes bacterium]|nr:hypothetical protein [Planctomycetota bacterium]
MTNFVWTEELTVYALSTLEHGTWAIINPHDMLNTIEKIQLNGGNVTSEEIDQIREDYQVKHEDFRLCLEHLGLITKFDGNCQITDEANRPGFYSGKELAEIIADLGPTSSQAINALGHNFILNAKESLPFCCLLLKPGVPKYYLRGELLNHYLFNQKLNSFKFDNLIDNLVRLGVVKKTEFGLTIGYAPPALTFFQIAKAYLFLASNVIGQKVNAGDLQYEIDCLLPSRDEDYTVLGFDQFPVEGWGKHQAWMPSESFIQLLKIGLIDPLCIARVLNVISKDETNPSKELAKLSLIQLKNKIIDDVRKFRSEPVNLSEILCEFDSQ